MEFLFWRILFHTSLQTYSIPLGDIAVLTTPVVSFEFTYYITSKSFIRFLTRTISFLWCISLDLLFFFVLHHFSSDFSCLNTRSSPAYFYWKQIISFSRAPSLVIFLRVRPKTGIPVFNRSHLGQGFNPLHTIEIDAVYCNPRFWSNPKENYQGWGSRKRNYSLPIEIGWGWFGI